MIDSLNQRAKQIVALYRRAELLAEIAQQSTLRTPGHYVGAELDQLIRAKLGGLGYEF